MAPQNTLGQLYEISLDNVDILKLGLGHGSMPHVLVPLSGHSRIVRNREHSAHVSTDHSRGAAFDIETLSRFELFTLLQMQ
jgi:hypothetical protein